MSDAYHRAKRFEFWDVPAIPQTKPLLDELLETLNGDELERFRQDSVRATAAAIVEQIRRADADA